MADEITWTYSSEGNLHTVDGNGSYITYEADEPTEEIAEQLRSMIKDHLDAS